MAEKQQRRSWSRTEKQRLVTEARRLRLQGEAWRSIAARLKVDAGTLQRWMHKWPAIDEPGLCRVDVVGDAPATEGDPASAAAKGQQHGDARASTREPAVPPLAHMSSPSCAEDAVPVVSVSRPAVSLVSPAGFRLEGIDAETAVRLWRSLR